MDYSGIVKRAWQVAWKYKVLWLFGLFAGGMGGGGFSSSNSGSSNFGSGSRTGTGRFPFGGVTEQQVQHFAERSLPLVIALALFLVVVGILWWVLAVAARGGIVHLVNEAESGRPISASDGWRVGFSKWGRVFAIRFIASLPLLVLGLLVAALLVVGAVTAYGSAAGRGGDAATAAIIASASGLCCVLAAFVIVALVLGVVLTIVSELGVCYGVLEDRGVMDSLKAGWADLRAKRGAFVMYLVQWAASIVYGIAAAVVALVVVVPAVVLFIAGAWPVGLLLIVAFALVMLVPAALYGAFYHAAWTIFFRRMTGMEPKAAPAMPYPAPPVAPQAGFPPPPSVPAPPAAPSVPGASAPAPWEQAPPETAGSASDPWVAANSLPEEPAGPGEPPADA